MQSEFGKRGATVDGRPIDDLASQVTPRSLHSPDSSTEQVSWPKIAAMICAILLFLAWFEALLAGTSLITPISQTLLWTMRGIGMVVGLIVTVVAVVAMSDVSMWRRILTLLICPFLVAFGFGEVAYRIADWTEFGFSSQPFAPAQYPIASIHHGRKGARNTIQIDPFATGDSTDIPISTDQYQDLRTASAESCVTVMQRKSASGAIEITTNGEFMWNTPEPVPVALCGGATPVQSGGSNPWSKATPN